MIDRSRLAGYLDEAGDDPASAVETLNAHNIKWACLRQLWTGNIIEISDHALARAKVVLEAGGIRTAMLATELGPVPAADFTNSAQASLERPFHLAAYFGATYVRFPIDKRADLCSGADIDRWMEDIQNRAIRANVVPLLELGHDQTSLRAAEVARALALFPRWKLLYDPSQLMLRRKFDPFVEYWTLLKSKVGAVDLHDVKVGHSFRPVGHGDASWERTLRDAETSKYSGWYFLEPGLGRRYGSAQTRRETFGLAVTALNSLEEECRSTPMR